MNRMLEHLPNTSRLGEDQIKFSSFVPLKQTQGLDTHP